MIIGAVIATAPVALINCRLELNEPELIVFIVWIVLVDYIYNILFIRDIPGNFPSPKKVPVFWAYASFFWFSL
jgi:hypothetical protein